MKILVLGILMVPSVLLAQTKKSKTTTVKKTTANIKTTSVQRGAVLYKTHCLSCHQADGGGVGTLNPPFVQQWAGGEKSRIIRMLLKGSSGKVEIDGDTFSNTMPPQPAFTDQQIADVLTYIRNNFGVKASAVAASEVKAVRAKAK